MSQEQRIKAAPFTLWLIPGFMISIGLLALAVAVAARIPWSIFAFEGPGPPQPLVSSATGWFIVTVAVGFTGLGLWFDRRSPKRIDPLARIALCLSVLGFGEAISGALAMSSGAHWPVNLVDVSVWMLLAAAALGVVSWVRIRLSKGALRGWIFATCSVVCSAGYAWIVFFFLASSPASAPEDGIDLPLVRSSFPDRPDPEEYRPELRVGLAGAEDLPDLVEIATRMEQEDLSWSPDTPPIYLPDEPVLIRADAGASWTSVRGVLTQVGEAKIWKVDIATRWEEPPIQTHLRFYLPRRLGVDIADAEPPPSPHHLEMHEEGRFSLDGEPFATLDELSSALVQLHFRASSDNPRALWIDPNDSATWQEVLDVVVVSTKAEHSDLQLDSLPIQVELPR